MTHSVYLKVSLTQKAPIDGSKIKNVWNVDVGCDIKTMRCKLMECVTSRKKEKAIRNKIHNVKH